MAVLLPPFACRCSPSCTSWTGSTFRTRNNFGMPLRGEFHDWCRCLIQSKTPWMLFDTPASSDGFVRKWKNQIDQFSVRATSTSRSRTDMKRSRVPRRRAYDRLYAMADAVLKRANPCAKCGVCKYFGGEEEGCCKGCPFLSPTGCTVQSLGCKLWLCHKTQNYLSDRHHHQLCRLRRLADVYGFRFARATKEEALSAPLHARGDVWYFYYKLRRDY